VGEFRTAENDRYGALTDLEMTLLLADQVKPGGEILFYTGSYAYDVAERVEAELLRQRSFERRGTFKSLQILARSDR
jgi:hypothetical protein